MAFQIGESGSVTLKAVLIGVIVLLLLVPLAMLRGLVSERSSLREQAYSRVAEGWGGSAVLGGPMLVVPTQRTVTEKIDDKKEVTRIIRSELYLLPARLDMKVDLKLQDEARYVGIYAVPVYLAELAPTERRGSLAGRGPLPGGCRAGFARRGSCHSGLSSPSGRRTPGRGGRASRGGTGPPGRPTRGTGRSGHTGRGVS